MKKIVSVCLVTLLLVSFGVFALGSGESTEPTQSGTKVEATQPNVQEDPTQAGANVETTPTAEPTEDNRLGKYAITIDSYRLAEDYEGKPIVIVKYIFQNVSDEDGAAFMYAFEDKVFQAGIGLNETFVADDSAKYSSDNQMKEIKVGATLEVEVAYDLNDTTTPIDVEVEEFISFDDKKITKTFAIS